MSVMLFVLLIVSFDKRTMAYFGGYKYRVRLQFC